MVPHTRTSTPDFTWPELESSGRGRGVYTVQRQKSRHVNALRKRYERAFNACPVHETPWSTQMQTPLSEFLSCTIRPVRGERTHKRASAPQMMWHTWQYPLSKWSRKAKNTRPSYKHGEMSYVIFFNRSICHIMTSNNNGACRRVDTNSVVTHRAGKGTA